ncbi:hypothetical protein JAAARDRAFT_40447 [Jaapia argillacea MUCL 33604]|uniref:Uncharacterized protein n=1 Tax=Jaapia argillacea MUCL 33604 TaxID=933084 RepID=A0A067PPT4_9AGAM|nr:hypothetical protein JAAARDRAFT_40447 [Jaapia argillacea MUCL 33604]
MSSTTFDYSADANYNPLECLSKPIFDASDLPVMLLFVYHTIYAYQKRSSAFYLKNMIGGRNSVANI